MKRILCIGEALIDMICTDKGSSIEKGEHFLKKPGGAPTNVAAAIAALGGQTTLTARVGDDPFGHQLINTMKEFGVSTQWMIRDEDHSTTMAYVSLLENGDRDFIFSRGADGYLKKEDVQFIDLDEYGIVHFGSATAFLPGLLQSAYNYLLQSSSINNLFISFDPNYRHLLFKNDQQSFISQSLNFLAQSHFAKLSEQEALMITSTSTLEDAASKLFEKIGVFAITLGDKGALLGFEGNTEIIPATTSNVIDTTGAGDAFAGAVLYQLQKRPLEELNNLSFEDWKTTIANANKIGALVCEHMGAIEAFKYLNDKAISL
jgi:fructokinase